MSTKLSLNLSGDCFTISGAMSGKKCVFPFRYNGVLNHQCTMQDHDSYWCSTENDENGDHVEGQWGNCGLCGSGRVIITDGILYQY